MAERIILNLPHGSSSMLAAEAAQVAYAFAASHLDRKAGARAVATKRGWRYEFVCHWTAKRAVVVTVRAVTP